MPGIVTSPELPRKRTGPKGNIKDRHLPAGSSDPNLYTPTTPPLLKLGISPDDVLENVKDLAYSVSRRVEHKHPYLERLLTLSKLNNITFHGKSERIDRLKEESILQQRPRIDLETYKHHLPELPEEDSPQIAAMKQFAMDSETGEWILEVIWDLFFTLVREIDDGCWVQDGTACGGFPFGLQANAVLRHRVPKVERLRNLIDARDKLLEWVEFLNNGGDPKHPPDDLRCRETKTVPHAIRLQKALKKAADRARAAVKKAANAMKAHKRKADEEPVERIQKKAKAVTERRVPPRSKAAKEPASKANTATTTAQRRVSSKKN
ncbi:uncharacterized protein J4E87_010689 [Alternaria ethzedia]|uniref:uncharacterized protein n=1 Tax=Alternaria ethzedia TaxID=181014 RepID=UPI0020C25946|nr:uncharacterized protein J4E87_010689 [Alternaria ethzedia]KAI4610755.1 hypothetical protein J4E87_010689 [Alternaria ethzedia]